MPDVTINIPQSVIDRFDAIPPAGQPTEVKMAQALKEVAFSWEKQKSQKNIQDANKNAQAAENARLGQVKDELEL